MSIEHLRVPCGCIMDCPSKISLILTYDTPKHQALHREFDAGIIHDWKCKMVMIPVAKLVWRFPPVQQ